MSVEVVDETGGVGGADEDVLWRIESTDGPESAPSIYLIGTEPTGFSMTVPLRAGLPDRAISAVVDTTFTQIAIGFQPAKLREGEVLTDDGSLVPVQAFRNRAKDACV